MVHFFVRNTPVLSARRICSRLMFKNEKLNVTLFLALVGLQVLGVVALWTRFQWSYLPIMLFMYFWGGISTTLYLHRYLTHRGFEMPGWLKFFFATGSAVALSGDPVTWVGDHRYHHLKSDTDEDIHSPIHGFPYAHMMWLVRKPAGFRERKRDRPALGVRGARLTAPDFKSQIPDLKCLWADVAERIVTGSGVRSDPAVCRCRGARSWSSRSHPGSRTATSPRPA